MKQSIQLRLGQQLTMTPQLQQAIRLLQLSSVELQTEIQEALESNLMLESGDEATDEGDPGEASADSGEESETAARSEDNEVGTTGESLPDDLPVDTSWDDVYEPGSGASSGTAPAGEEGEYTVQNSAPEDLHDHLLWQLNMSHLTPRDTLIGEAVIDAVGDDGYLTADLEELSEAIAPDLPDIETDEIRAVLHQIQNFDPPGIAAADLRESLLLQLDQLAADPEPAGLATARAIVADHFDLLGRRDFNQLQRRLHLDEAGLADILRLIQSLNPRPGGQITAGEPEYVTPDVIVRRDRGRWRVELNPEVAPRLRINTEYADLIRRGDQSDDATYLRNHLQEARWFLKSLQSRNETLLKVATSIVERQRDFLEQGEEAMKPLVLRDIAEEVEMHESTISRVTTRKYMLTPRGVFELKYFFSSHVGTNEGGEASSTAIQARIRRLIEAEETRKPLSDSRIARILADEGFQVARRTVAKYREGMQIPPSNERRRLT
ncbi:RNA polymerase, sigma 54 subunit, RpoN/SigL [Thiohalospira halophila DSM 15071]|uniref:RNA polymerase sigma-54 factor n=1 Tax=Thiohalospira halophila DSM 15071 TaxID=1123397 RepID=A0A1I1QV51_9GAMM|nr:RNA polymerase factor sigma-54 [Thiohalospira halophila]SFD25877.1 RNA polymerase, sigma 54 subunit, RpoN/SigL [Thiohalospira halophila DSM 15071]